MARRGEQLREHILWVAKDVFLTSGFERASMDEVAAQAETSKRSLYAHFESKERLFLAVIELVRSLFLARLRQPADYSDTPAEALVLFCGRYLETLLFDSQIQMIRLSVAETGRFAEGAARYYDVAFTEVHQRLSAFVRASYGVSDTASDAAVQNLLGQLVYPRFLRALFGLDQLLPRPESPTLSPDFDLKPGRAAVAEMLTALGVD